ncbi:hypothetical protein ACFPFV_10315 [Salinicoccus siamensis]|uniref:Uncharacterized protein n=1 Tax=Salinicoccus siamensis TaxID=381830 RepID=A0ABV5Z2R6_9STAP
MVKHDEHMSDKDVNIKGEREEDLVYIEGQNREMIQKEKVDKKNPLMWIIPILIVLLIIPLIVNQFSGGGSEEKEEEESAAIIQEAPATGAAAVHFEATSEQELASEGDMDGVMQAYQDADFATFPSTGALMAAS